VRAPIIGLLFLSACTDSGSLDDLDDARLVESFVRLHSRVYDLYALALDADAVHDHLAASFAGEALTAQYVEHWGTRVHMQRDGTSVDVRRVSHEPPKVIARGPAAADVDASWSVGGVVHHKSHSHPRVNRYEAVYTLSMTDTGLRIVDTHLRQAERVRDLLNPADGGWILDDLPTTDGGFLDAIDLLEAGVLETSE
jgi:hypothetical protein